MSQAESGTTTTGSEERRDDLFSEEDYAALRATRQPEDGGNFPPMDPAVMTPIIFSLALILTSRSIFRVSFCFKKFPSFVAFSIGKLPLEEEKLSTIGKKTKVLKIARW